MEADDGSLPFAVVGLVQRNGLVLAVSRKTNHEDLGLPGGKLDPGETPEEAVRREIFEETGLVVLSLTRIFDHMDRVEGLDRKPCRCFRIDAWEGEPDAFEGAVVQWVKPSRLLEDSCTFRDYNRTLFTTIDLDVGS